MPARVCVPRWWRCADAAFFLGVSPTAVRRLVRDGRLRGEIRATRTRAPSMPSAYRREKLAVSHEGLWTDAFARCRREDQLTDLVGFERMRRVWPMPLWFTSASAAALLGVSPRYVRTLYRAGRLQGEIRTTRFRGPGWPHAYRRRRLMIFAPSIFALPVVDLKGPPALATPQAAQEDFAPVARKFARTAGHSAPGFPGNAALGKNGGGRRQARWADVSAESAAGSCAAR